MRPSTGRWRSSRGRREGAELVAAHEPAVLRRAVVAVYGQLRAIGQRRPTLPAPRQSVGVGELAAEFASWRSAAARELGEIDQPGVTVAKALDTLARAGELLAGELPWPGDLEAISLPGGAVGVDQRCRARPTELGSLSSGEALASELAIPMRDALDELLRGYGERYGQLKQRSSALDFDDLELLARDLLSREEIGSRYRERFEHVMVDELQDTNRVQLELVDAGRREAARCSWSAMRSSRSTASGTPMSSCSRSVDASSSESERGLP